PIPSLSLHDAPPISRRGSKAGARGQSRAPNTPTSPSGSSGRSKGRVGLKHRHGRGEKGDRPLATFHPCVNDGRPFLEHMAALNLVRCLVVDAARRSPVLVGEAFLDPVAVETEFIQQR